jgi:hypothetical protein
MREVSGFIPIIYFRFDSVFSTVIDRALAHMQNFLLEFGREKTRWFDAAGFTRRYDCRFRWCPLGKLMGMRGLRGGHYSSAGEEGSRLPDMGGFGLDFLECRN